MPGTILFFLAAVVMLTLDLHHWILVGFARTYLVLPIGGPHLNGATLAVVGQPPHFRRRAVRSPRPCWPFRSW